jgi:catalase
VSLCLFPSFLQYHWKCEQGVEQFTHEQSLIQGGEDPDFAKRDLFGQLSAHHRIPFVLPPERAGADVHTFVLLPLPFSDHIEKGGDARWKLFVQVMKPEEAATASFDPFDVTKVWPRGEFPMQEVGQLVLNRNPEDYHRFVLLSSSLAHEMSAHEMRRSWIDG